MKLFSIISVLVASHFSFAQLSVKSSQEIIREIHEVNRQMEAQFNKGRYAEIGYFYSDSAAMIGNKVEVVGKDDLLAYWSKFENAHEWKIENIQITVINNSTVLQRGYSNISFYQGATLQTARSIFSLVWIKTKEGWKILLDHFSPR